MTTQDDFVRRAAVILHNMALERTGWRRYVFGRWYVPAEPLRNDAGRLLSEYRCGPVMMPANTRVVNSDDRG